MFWRLEVSYFHVLSLVTCAISGEYTQRKWNQRPPWQDIEGHSENLMIEVALVVIIKWSHIALDGPVLTDLIKMVRKHTRINLSSSFQVYSKSLEFRKVKSLYQYLLHITIIISQLDWLNFKNFVKKFSQSDINK